MAIHGYGPSCVGLEKHGIENPGDVYWNLPPAELVEFAIRDGEGTFARNGALVCQTGKHTGRSPKDRYIVEEPTSKDLVCWGKTNQPISEAQFDTLHRRMIDHYKGKRLYVRDMFAGADAESRLAIRVVTESAWHNLFASQLFIKPEPGSTATHDPTFTVLNAPTCLADATEDGLHSETFVVLNLAKRLVLIGGTAYAGEIKKSIFSVMNYLLPQHDVMTMHCSANVGAAGDVALFFGLSGTGKTTLSADPDRRLIGDDEHGWNDRGVFNFEGGCYAKCIKLSQEKEPQIFNAIRFGSVLENVIVDEALRRPDYDCDKLTENTRAAYPLDYIDGAVIPSIAGHPNNVVFLTCDAFGVLPPISKLSPDQAMYHFLAGYTAKVAGTEAGVTEPVATFSSCFGEPFLPLPPERYAQLLGQKLETHHAKCWLINTGWSGGGVGVGKRIDLPYTRAMVNAAIGGGLDNAEFIEDPVFKLQVPTSCPGVPSKLLSPKSTWSDPAKFEAKAKELAELFEKNASNFSSMPTQVAACGPRV